MSAILAKDLSPNVPISTLILIPMLDTYVLRTDTRNLCRATNIRATALQVGDMSATFAAVMSPLSADTTQATFAAKYLTDFTTRRRAQASVTRRRWNMTIKGSQSVCDVYIPRHLKLPHSLTRDREMMMDNHVVQYQVQKCGVDHLSQLISYSICWMDRLCWLKWNLSRIFISIQRF